ncbi:MAG: DbpA RNA binding domain-containing protein, partial [Bdellovibrionota bacterium]|nr:DbpA RNA binding domain-containing protein [Bdellovibrionota bacterium]
ALNLFTSRERDFLEELDETSFSFETPSPEGSFDSTPPMETLLIFGGKKNKIRPGDILGALTGEAGIPGKSVGNINLLDRYCYVAVEKELSQKALIQLQNGKIKGRKFRVSKT